MPELGSKLSAAKNYLERMFALNLDLGKPDFIIGIIIFAFLLILILVVFKLKRKIKDYEQQNDIARKLIDSIDVQSDLKKQLNGLLDIVISIVETDGYFVYAWDPKSEKYVLRSTRYSTSDLGIVEISYSGLASYEKEKYNPPLSISEWADNPEPEFIKDGEVPLLRLCLAEGKCQIRMGPVKNIKPKQFKQLKILGEKADTIVATYLAIDKLNNDVEVITTTGKAITELSKSAFKMESLSSKIMAISSQMVEAGGCCFALKERGKWNVPLYTGLDNKIEEDFVTDYEALGIMYEVVRDKSSLLITQDSKEFYTIPYYLVASGVQAILLVETEGVEGMAIFFFNRVPSIESYSLSVVLLMTKRLGELWENQAKLHSLSDSYVHMLQILVDSTDNLEPTTVGHSELIANYSTAIAMELRLPQKEIENIRMAAYFHDVGMLTLSNDILQKQGKYTHMEFEMMKLHTIVGASIMETITSNEKVVTYIRHHHERWDGHGYPDGMKQEQIPLGARIIAVADMFNAKLQGRKYREPVTFEKAVNDLLAASGTQLDPKLADTLLSWLNKKRSKAVKGRAMGPCWEMRCCPPHIHKDCPAYRRKDENCWDLEGVNCSAHGSKCSTCFVKTEVLSRNN